MLLQDIARCSGRQVDTGLAPICLGCDRRTSPAREPVQFIAPAAILRRIAHDLTDWHCDNRRSSGYVEAEADRVEG